jgi:ABC-type branched-subunit amino acid transport system ATPase component
MGPHGFGRWPAFAARRPKPAGRWLGAGPGTACPASIDDRVLTLFPPLRMTNPRLLILAEATEGLAPLVRAMIWRVLGQLKRDGMAILLVDKNVAYVARLADRHYVLEKGRVVWSGNSTALIADQALRSRYLGV